MYMGRSSCFGISGAMPSTHSRNPPASCFSSSLTCAISKRLTSTFCTLVTTTLLHEETHQVRMCMRLAVLERNSEVLLKNTMKVASLVLSARTPSMLRRVRSAIEMLGTNSLRVNRC